MIESFLEWGVAQQTLTGEKKSGDGYFMKSFGDNVLVAVVDGLGHGEEAAAAARIAIDTLAANVRANIISLFERSHEALRTSRGVVMSAALFNGVDGTATWMGVGNVEGLLVRASTTVKPQRESLLIRPGVLGGRLPALHAAMMPIMAGDTVAFATDGIVGGLAEKVNSRDSPMEIAAGILAHHAKGTDDALVLVARYLGSQ